jgi:hypothetical protein
MGPVRAASAGGAWAARPSRLAWFPPAEPTTTFSPTLTLVCRAKEAWGGRGVYAVDVDRLDRRSRD